MLHKALSAGIRDVDALQGVITGYAAAFNIIDADQDIIVPGAFSKTLAEQGPQSKQPRIKFLYQHDATKLLGIPSVLKETDIGLYFEVTLADTPLARDVLTLYAEKVLTEHSIGYEVVEATWDRTQNARLLRQLKLYEFSVVTWGAQSQTPVISVKSLANPNDLSALADRAQRLDALLHTGDLHSTALCETLERELKALHTALAPADAGARPYTIQVVTDTMADLVQRLQSKAATDDTQAAPINDGGKAAPMNRQIKGTGGDLAVSEDGSHATYTGTHTHSHKAMGSQGDDALHEHAHEHKDDAAHGHEHKEKAAPQPQRRKARDFGTLFASLNESDQLQDDWGDTFIALVQAMQELMAQSQYQQGGWLPEGAEVVDIEAAARANLDAFSTAVMTLVTRSIAADFVPAVTCDRDQFIDPDGPNADDDDDDSDYKARAPIAMPAAPAPLRKAGRAIGSANRKVITEALDGMAEAMKALKSHHGAIADLMTKTDPDHVRQDEDTALGDDDTENGGSNPNKGRTLAPDRLQAGTTHGLLTALDADLSALRGRK